ncbi:MAG: tryptophan--tRNA ligase, partial [Oscillospiraceae bacterium]|nr:tryptophan--tRNA ligase [Oscillospiraceae bacterium]
GYGDFKTAVGEAVADHLEPVRTEYARLIADKAYIKECYTKGAEQATRIAQKTMSKAYRKVGFVDIR